MVIDRARAGLVNGVSEERGMGGGDVVVLRQFLSCNLWPSSFCLFVIFFVFVRVFIRSGRRGSVVGVLESYEYRD